MTLEEIKAAVDAGATVRWSNELYRVIKTTDGGYQISCPTTDSHIGLTWRDGVTMNGREDQFYVERRITMADIKRYIAHHTQGVRVDRSIDLWHPGDARIILTREDTNAWSVRLEKHEETKCK
jgi:hypothetical protein